MCAACLAGEFRAGSVPRAKRPLARQVQSHLHHVWPTLGGGDASMENSGTLQQRVTRAFALQFGSNRSRLRWISFYLSKVHQEHARNQTYSDFRFWYCQSFLTCRALKSQSDFHNSPCQAAKGNLLQAALAKLRLLNRTRMHLLISFTCTWWVSRSDAYQSIWV